MAGWCPQNSHIEALIPSNFKKKKKRQLSLNEAFRLELNLVCLVSS